MGYNIRQLEICNNIGVKTEHDSYILDFGCGNGKRVYELLDSGFFNSYGYDIKNTVILRNDNDKRHFKFSTTGEIPFIDNYFDLIISEQVFEHVMDQKKVLKEIYRILKKEGVAIHFFPAKWRIIEPHIFVPFGGIAKNFLYYYFWAFLGIHNQFQKGLSASEIANRNKEYATKHLNYLSCKEYNKILEEIGFQYKWLELNYLLASDDKFFNFTAKICRHYPFLLNIIRRFYSRVLFCQKK